MATKSDKPPSKPPAYGQRHVPDFLLEPIPVPEAIESDTDTAWGRWEETLLASEKPPGSAGADQQDADFGDTLPSALAPLSETQKTRK